MDTSSEKRYHALMTLTLSVVLMQILIACQSSPSTAPEGIPELQQGQEAISFLGDTLLRPVLDTTAYHRADSLLEEAFTFYKEDSTDLDAIIWYGRRLAYLHQYRDAIDIYTRGIQLHPGSPELLRHRGHRYITIRQLDLAIGDLERAAMLAKDHDPEIEPDGIPNKLDIPLSNLHFNIYYHLGLAYYLRADFSKAADAFKTCMGYSDNPDLKVATTYWLYLSRLRMGPDHVDEMLLSDIHPHMEIIENEAYLRQLLFFKAGGRSGPEIHSPPDTLPVASAQYGISCWYDGKGQSDKAAAIRREILASGIWPMFGYIAAEADAARLIAQ